MNSSSGVHPFSDDKPRLEHALLWLDLETSGLDPGEGVILEACAILTDMDLNEIRRVKFVVGHERENILDTMDDYVLKMHLDNGLLKEVWQSNRHIVRVDEELAALASHHWLSAKCRVYLAGSSIHFDRKWVAVHMPRLDKALHYRMVDVSSFTTAFPGVLTKTVSGGHRAESDIENSIAIHRQLMNIVNMVKAQSRGVSRAKK